MKRKVTKHLLAKDPKGETAFVQISFYNKSKGNTKITFKKKHTRSDTTDYVEVFYDNGSEEIKIREGKPYCRIPQGTIREACKTNLIYPIGLNKNVVSEKFIQFIRKGLLPTDRPKEDAKNCSLWYKVYSDGGIKEDYEEQIIQKGDEFNPMHPLPSIYIGKNGMMQGAISMTPIITARQKNKESNNEILLPIQMFILDENGELLNPLNALTYQESAVLHGRWNEEGKIDWKVSDSVQVDARESERGLTEPSIIELIDGRILMVMRGGSGAEEKSGYRWYSISEDGGYTWGKLDHWRYTDYEDFYSPSSCSQLLRHSNGKIYWIGNISRVPTKRNWPRYPLVIGEVDEETGLLIKESISIIADREEGQSEKVTYSNFYAYEDRESGNIKLHLTPLHVVEGKHANGTAAYLFEIEIKE